MSLVSSFIFWFSLSSLVRLRSGTLAVLKKDQTSTTIVSYGPMSPKCLSSISKECQDLRPLGSGSVGLYLEDTPDRRTKCLPRKEKVFPGLGVSTPEVGQLD